MLKLEIKLDDEKILTDKKYQREDIYYTLKKSFEKCQLIPEIKSDGTLIFHGTGAPGDFGSFGYLITSLKERSWFMDYVIKWLWYNSDDGENEEDYHIEDVLYHYTRKESVA